jgi:hypothetical protein
VRAAGAMTGDEPAEGRRKILKNNPARQRGKTGGRNADLS